MEIKGFNKSLGLYIKSVRENRGLTQAELSALMNINPQNISGYERGERSPSLFWITRLCKALQMKPTEFFDGFYKELEK
jgi:transcriptional regulator with XRE-family HTH domain